MPNPTTHKDTELSEALEKFKSLASRLFQVSKTEINERDRVSIQDRKQQLHDESGNQNV